jgi:hypothetical protein
VLESKSVVPGGGCVEAALSVYMEHMADTMGSREQLAVAAFAQALLVIPKTLAVNGAYDATELVSQLRSFHHSAQTSKEHPEHRWTGLDLETGAVRDNLKAGVLEPAISKVKMIRFATEAAVTILRIDDAIKFANTHNHRALCSSQRAIGSPNLYHDLALWCSQDEPCGATGRPRPPRLLNRRASTDATVLGHASKQRSLAACAAGCLPFPFCRFAPLRLLLLLFIPAAVMFFLRP